MKSWWQHWKSAFTQAECQAIVTHMLKTNPVEGVVGHGGATTKSDIRRSNVRWLSRHDPFMKPVYDRIDYMVRRSNAEAFGFDIDFNHEVQGTEYDSSNSGHYDWHEDNTWVPTNGSVFDRKISVVLQLTHKENYAGGRLELDRAPLPDDRFNDIGDLIIFPSFLKHRVTPLTSGVRHSLVTWYQGPRFR